MVKGKAGSRGTAKRFGKKMIEGIREENALGDKGDTTKRITEREENAKKRGR